jgi:antitoxin Phd
VDWQVQQAKARFSELLDRTLKEGAQTITRHGKAVAVMVPVEEYRRLSNRGKSLKALLADAPLEGLEIVGTRDSGRTIKLRSV